MSPTPAGFLTVAQVAARLAVSPRRVRHLLAAGRLSGMQVHPTGPWLIDAGAVERLQVRPYTRPTIVPRTE